MSFSDISWVKPTEPSFLKKFKSDVGYKEGPNVDTKRQAMPTLDDDSGSDREDELPQVVVLKKGDLSADEVKHIKGDGASEKEDEPPADGKIVFKKPAKRSSTDKYQGITASSSKKKKSHVFPTEIKVKVNLSLSLNFGFNYNGRKSNALFRTPCLIGL
uniref:Zgc:77056 n=1 Tax=Gadus morhua TaxID=8049 RepID=A0A8C5CQ24_GADMO